MVVNESPSPSLENCCLLVLQRARADARTTLSSSSVPKSIRIVTGISPLPFAGFASCYPEVMDNAGTNKPVPAKLGVHGLL